MISPAHSAVECRTKVEASKGECEAGQRESEDRKSQREKKTGEGGCEFEISLISRAKYVGPDNPVSAANEYL